MSLLKASINALSITFSFLKFSSNGSVISISFTLNIDDFKSVLEKLKNRTVVKKLYKLFSDSKKIFKYNLF